MTKIVNCELHGNYDAEIITGSWGGEFTSCCPTCDKEMHEREEIEKKEYERKNFESKMRRFNIERAYWESTMENYETNTPELKKNKDKVQELLDGSIKKIIMTGKNGTGKTHLACAAIHKLGGKIMTMYEISTTIRASYTSLAEKSELEIVDDLAHKPLLVIDEIGRTKGGDSEANWLSYILDKRHVRDLPTILITNKHVRKTCEKQGCPDCLENYIGEDIMSRLSENGCLLKFTGEDWRRKKVN